MFTAGYSATKDWKSMGKNNNTIGRVETRPVVMLLQDLTQKSLNYQLIS